MFKNKIFIFDELNYLLLPAAIIIKIFRHKVYFLRLKKIWQNEKSIKILKFLGFSWLNFQDYEIKKTAEISRDVVFFQNSLGNYIDGLNIANDLKKILEEKGCNNSDLKSFALTKASAPLRKFSEVMKFIDILKKSKKDNFIIISQFPSFLNTVLKKEAKNKAFILNLYSFDPIISLLKIFLKKIKYKIKTIKNNNNNKINNNNLNIKKFKTVFFPHQGVYYGDIYKKDQFYSKKINSYFYPSNILHLSIGDQNLNDDLTNEFYEKNKITNIDFVSLGNISLKEFFLTSWNFIKEYYIFSRNSLGSVIFFLALWISIKKSLNRLDALPNAQVAIFGFDLLAPREISIACRIKKIQTIATQERFLEAWCEDFFFIFDHYLVINKNIETVLLDKKLNSVRKIKSIGPVRSDMINTTVYEKSINDKKTVLILDSHSKTNLYSNGRANFSNWKQNYTFYESIMSLAKENMDIKFIIKGKNYCFIDIPYFKNIKKIIDQTKNIELYKNESNSPYELIESAHLAIARYTSLIDEMLYKERSVLIYETGGYPSTFFNYGENLVVKNYEELKTEFDKWKEDPKKFNESIVNQSRNYFPVYKPNNKVYDLLHTYLEGEFKYYLNQQEIIDTKNE